MYLHMNVHKYILMCILLYQASKLHYSVLLRLQYMGTEPVASVWLLGAFLGRCWCGGWEGVW